MTNKTDHHALHATRQLIILTDEFVFHKCKYSIEIFHTLEVIVMQDLDNYCWLRISEYVLFGAETTGNELNRCIKCQFLAPPHLISSSSYRPICQ